MLSKFKAVIWDCDGCLIDSEKIACLAAAEMLTERGYKVTLDQFLEKFMGKGLQQILSDIDAETGRDFCTTFPREELQARQKDVFTRMLKATDGIESVLQAIKVPMAVGFGQRERPPRPYARHHETGRIFQRTHLQRRNGQKWQARTRYISSGRAKTGRRSERLPGD